MPEADETEEKQILGRRSYDNQFGFQHLYRKVNQMEEVVVDLKTQINNGMSDTVEDNRKRINDLEEKSYKLFLALGGFMTAVILLLLSILLQL